MTSKGNKKRAFGPSFQLLIAGANIYKLALSLSLASN